MEPLAGKDWFRHHMSDSVLFGSGQHQRARVAPDHWIPTYSDLYSSWGGKPPHVNARRFGGGVGGVGGAGGFAGSNRPRPRGIVRGGAEPQDSGDSTVPLIFPDPATFETIPGGWFLWKAIFLILVLYFIILMMFGLWTLYNKPRTDAEWKAQIARARHA